MDKIPKAETYEVRFGANPALLGDTILNVYTRDKKQQIIGRYSIFVSIEAYAKYIKTSRLIKSGEIIRESDVNIVYNAIYSSPRFAIQKQADVIGKEAKSTISKDGFIVNWMVQSQRLIHIGDKVTAKWQDQTIQLKFEGISLENGGKGDRIRIKSASFNKELEGEVVDSQNVYITPSF